MTVRLDDLGARATAQSLDAMLAELDDAPDSRERSLALDAIDALVQLYGEGLARLVIAHRENRISDDLLRRDDVLSRLLSVHDLLPRTPPTSALVQLERRRGSTSDDDSAIESLLSDTQTNCQLCAAPIDGNHGHLLDIDKQQLACACGACAILFDGRAAGPTRYRLIPRRYQSLDRSALDGGLWERLELPVDVVFMFMSTKAGRPVAFYPGPMGTTESTLPLPAWDQLVAASPVLATLEPDVEALLVRRTRGARDYWILPVDECYRLAGSMRVTWEGITGGDTMRRTVEAFFARLAKRQPRAPRVAVTTTNSLSETSWTTI